MMDLEFDHEIKILLIGESGVGKTSLILRYTEEIYPENHIPTIGVDFKLKVLRRQEKTLKVQIWDTAGQERFKTITSKFYKGAMGIALVYDIRNEYSFRNIKRWVAQIKESADADVVLMLLANKCDYSDKAVATSEGEALAADLGCDYYETSAKLNVNLEEAFGALCDRIMDKGVEPRKSVRLTAFRAKKQKKCCNR